MLDDRRRTPTHTEVAVGTRVVVSSDKGYTGYHEVLEAQPPHTTVVLCCSGSHHPLGNGTRGFVGLSSFGGPMGQDMGQPES